MSSLNESSNAEALHKANVIAKVEGGIEKDISHLDYDKDYFVCCRGCNKSLLTLVKVSDEGKKYFVLRNGKKALIPILKNSFSCNCPFCGSKSWVVNIEGTLMFDVDRETVTIEDVSMDWSSEEVVKITITLGKK